MIGPRKTPLPLALLSLIFTVESSKPSTNSEGLGWPGRPTLLALPKAKLSSLATSKRRAKTFIFNSEEELKDDPSEEEEKSLVGVPL